MASLIGTGPRQYLLGCEDLRSFDELKATFDGELQPMDPIERMWVDELVDLEWSLHRLRNTRRAVLETRLVDRLVNLTVLALGERRSERLPSPAILQGAARGYIRGVPDARDYIHATVGFLQLDVELQVVQAGAFDILSRVEHTIHATSRMRDAILTRIYGRRDAIADGRIASRQRG